jgi:hypothetical protein
MSVKERGILSPLRLPNSAIPAMQKQAAMGFAPMNSGFADRRLGYLAMPPRKLLLAFSQ